MTEFKLPEYETIVRNDIRKLSLTALEQFILDNEPAGIQAEVDWRQQLTAAIVEAKRVHWHQTDGQKPPNDLPVLCYWKPHPPHSETYLVSRYIDSERGDPWWFGLDGVRPPDYWTELPVEKPK